MTQIINQLFAWSVWYSPQILFVVGVVCFTLASLEVFKLWPRKYKDPSVTNKPLEEDYESSYLYLDYFRNTITRQLYEPTTDLLSQPKEKIVT